MFVDQVILEAKAGKGGDGIVAFRREKYVAFGGPAGGSGGAGGHIIFKAEEGLATLLDLRYNRHLRAKAGDNGGSKNQWGKKAEHLIVKVPVGTLIYDDETGKLIADLVEHEQEAIVAKGGRGGRGNAAFATGKNKAPSVCEKGEPGELKQLRIELKVLADVGLVGFPSVGKSTLISAVSAAKPKIAAYHFTTINPNLGLVRVDEETTFVMADLPGLIEGASSGLGLGHRFLRHIERCRVILHVIDMSGEEGRDPYRDYQIINEELKTYQVRMLERPQIVVANKMDMPGAADNLEAFRKQLQSSVAIYPISAITKEGLTALLYETAELLSKTPEFILTEEESDHMLFQFQPEKDPFEIVQESDGSYRVTGDKLAKLFAMTDFNHDEAVKRFSRQMRSFGLDQALRERGVKNGDIVRVFDFDFEFID